MKKIIFVVWIALNLAVFFYLDSDLSDPLRPKLMLMQLWYVLMLSAPSSFIVAFAFALFASGFGYITGNSELLNTAGSSHQTLSNVAMVCMISTVGYVQWFMFVPYLFRKIRSRFKHTGPDV